MLHYAIDRGLNYVDTAYPYHRGNSERFVGRALKGGYRDRVKLATKLPSWRIEGPEDFDRYLDEQLIKLQCEHIDLYLLHALHRKSWHKLRDFDVIKWAEGAIADGRIGHLGFSFHDDYAAFQEIVDAHDWTFCQIQYNYMDIETQAGTRGLEYAASKGLAVVIMEPLLGGLLVDPPAQVQEIWDSAPVRRSPADWALQWLWDQPEVSVVLSGMTTMQHVRENVASAEASKIDALTEEERALFARVREKYRELFPIPCTMCEYCLPCPSGVKIPRVFEILNSSAAYGKLEEARRLYEWLPEAQRGSACEQCRQCEDLCPQQIPISELMEPVHEVLGEGKPLDEFLAFYSRPG
jgi:predicted aldo/keto reductase-like oxidoreductase